MAASVITDMKLIAVTILSIVSLCFCEECKIKGRTPEMQTERNLKDHLQKCYAEILKPPVNKDSNTVVVNIDFVLQSFQFDYHEEIVTLYSWNYYDWQDDRLTWKPEDYKDIKWMPVLSFDIWSPGLKLVNTADADDFDFFYTKCRLNSTGHVRCVLRTEHRVFCTSNLSNWPYDTKSCTLQFDQWRPEQTKVIFSLSHIKFVMQSYINAGWMITREQVFKNVSTGIQSAVKFNFERLAEGLEATIVVPAFVTAVLTVTALMLDYRNITRLTILCLSLVSHFMFLTEISEYIPKHSANTPVILLFISRSTIMTVIVFVLSFGLRILGKKKTQAPNWIVFLNDSMLDTNVRYFVVTKWEVEEQNAKVETPNREWVNFISIANSLCLFVAIITYIYLLATYIPKKPVWSFLFEIA